MTTEERVAWRRYEVGHAAVRALAPVPDRGLRLVVDGREIVAGDLVLTEVGRTEDGAGLAWRLTGAGVGVGLVARAAGPVVSTWAVVHGTGRLSHVDVERWASSPGMGQPAIGSGWFAALEHPGAEHLGLAVDHDLSTGPFHVPRVVVGAAPAGEELAGFWDELDRVRARPPRLIVLANNWYQLGYVGKMDQDSVAAELSGFGAVAAAHGLALDWYCLDDPWDGEWEDRTGLWGRVAPSRFPGGLAGVQAAAEGNVGGVGLWISPWGGYFDRHDFRVAWGAEHGFEIDDGSWRRLCPAGDRYAAHLADALGRHTAAGVGYWKLDGVQFDCQSPGHGHAIGPGGRTDQMDRFAALLDGVRAVRPDAILTFTSGSNPSPWWLRHADYVWRGGLDDDAPAELEGGRHDRFATYIDGCLDTLRQSAVPVSAIVTFSLVENEARAYRDDGEDDEAWERHCWFLAGRGTHHHDLYAAPDSLSGTQWAALARALAWAKANERVLARSRMIGGRPEAAEPYGFLSLADGALVLCLRNPSARPQSITVELGGTADDLCPVWGRATAVPTRLHHAATVELEPFEVVLVSGRWHPGSRPGPQG